MDKQLPIKSKLDWFSIIIMLIVLILFVVLGIKLIKDSMAERYLQIIPFLGGLTLCSLLPLFCWLVTWRIKRYWVYSDRVEVISFMGDLTDTVYFKDIDYWTETKTPTRGGKLTTLSLYALNKKYPLVDDRFGDNYESVKKIITEGRQHNEELEQQVSMKMKRTTGIALMSIACAMLFIAFAIPAWRSSHRPGPFKMLNGTLSQAPQVITYSKSKQQDLYIHLKGYDDFTFNLSTGASLPNYCLEIADYAESGDNIDLKIDESVFKKKISHEVPLGFFDKTVGYKFIDVYGLRLNGKYPVKEEITPEERTNHSAERSKATLLFLIVFLALFLPGLYNYWKGSE